MLRIFSAATGSAASLGDPLGSSPLLAAVLWLQHTLLGTIATTVAVIAVAWCGFLMLSGRVNFRYGVTVVFGCFLIFGASAIVAGILDATRNSESSEGPALAAAPPPVIIPTPQPGYDPYAGASVPR